MKRFCFFNITLIFRKPFYGRYLGFMGGGGNLPSYNFLLVVRVYFNKIQKVSEKFGVIRSWRRVRAKIFGRDCSCRTGVMVPKRRRGRVAPLPHTSTTVWPAGMRLSPNAAALLSLHYHTGVHFSWWTQEPFDFYWFCEWWLITESSKSESAVH